MAKPYDSTTKYLIEKFPADWLALAGLDVQGPVELIDANLSTITAEADKVIRVAEPTPWLAHVELQASRDLQLGSRLLRYNALLDNRHDLPTRSLVVLLRPEADGPELSGEYRRSLPDGSEYLVFRYGVLRVWKQPVESILDGGLGVLPLAPVSDLSTMSIEDVVRAIGQRIDQEPPALSDLLWSSTANLMGLRLRSEMIRHLLKGVYQMKESSFYQSILAEGLAEGRAKGLAEGRAEGRIQQRLDNARRLLLKYGERRFGVIPLEYWTAIERTIDADRLENWFDLVYDTSVSSWAEFWARVEKSDADLA